MRRRTILLLSCLASLALSGCGSRPTMMSDRECLARAMYFESNRSSEEGMIAVGTVVMNRVGSPDFPNSVCQVVAQKNQFAPGVMTRKMDAGTDLAFKSAARVLRGERHRGVTPRSMFFHTEGYSFPYDNMHYVAIAGGNAFYEKRRDAHVTQGEVKQQMLAAERQRAYEAPPLPVYATSGAMPGGAAPSYGNPIGFAPLGEARPDPFSRLGPPPSAD